MEFNDTVGIDVSKETIDAFIYSSQNAMVFQNTVSGYKKLIKWVLKYIQGNKENILIAFEHTGLYSFPLSVYLTELGYKYIVIPGLEIRRSLGMSRGKDDQVDAKRIAQYAYEKRAILIPYKLPSKHLIEIKRLLSLREKLVKQKAGYQATLKENRRFLKRKENRILFEVQEKMINELKKQIQKVDKELDDFVKKDPQIKKLYDLITSIQGVGPQTALFMIVLTNGFTLFEKWRKFACYAGTAPFPNKSGTSLNGRTKVSHLANKKMKALLSSCAISAIQHNPEMRRYYLRRIEEGKNEMSTINIIRNKIISRIFAVVNRGTPYANTLGYIS
jgi:transposase